MLSIAEALKTEALGRATVVAGHGGLANIIQWVHMVDIPEMAEWVREGELIFTTAFGIRDNPELQHVLVRQLVSAGAVGMVIGVGHYFHEIPQVMIDQANELNFPLLTLPWEIPFIEVTRALVERIVQERYALLQQSLQVHKRLTEVVLSGAGLDVLAKVLARLVECAVTIEDASFRLLAYAAWGEVDPAREASILEGQTPARLLAELRRRGVLETLQTSLHPVHLEPLPEHGMQYERIVAPIIAAGERLGYVWLIPHNRTIREMDLVTIEHAATVAALIMVRERAVYEAEQRLQSGLLEELLRRPPLVRGSVAEKMRSFGLANGQQVVLVRPPGHAFPDALRLSRLVLEEMRAAGQRGIVVERGEDLVVLIGSRASEEGTDLAQRLVARGRHEGYPLTIGVGRRVQQLEELAQSYEEALEALEAGLALYGSGCVTTFESLGYLYWLRHLPAEVREQNAFARALADLADYDGKHRTMLLTTLETYLDAGANAQAASRRLFLHRNTLRQRLKRIEQIIGLRLTEPETRLNLHLALKERRLRPGCTSPRVFPSAPETPQAD
ncbi:MAG: PucR family transcriptional regulator ligand-binding domain-containing protein [Chloroflexia bacterium]